MERLKLRFFREAKVERWKVFAIALALPLLLQLALPAFSTGPTQSFTNWTLSLHSSRPSLQPLHRHSHPNVRTRYLFSRVLSLDSVSCPPLRFGLAI